MDKILQALFELTRCGLEGLVYETRIDDVDEVYQLMRDHGLAAVCFEAIDKRYVSNSFYERLKKTTDAFILRDLQQDILIKKLKHICDELKIPHIFLKGATIKSIYPKRYMRGMGDIDILIDEKDITRLHKALKESNIKLSSVSYAHRVYETKDHQMIEVHPRLLSHDRKVLINHPFETYISKEGYTYSFDHAYELIYLMSHLKKHILYSGIGFRSVLDIGLYVKTYEDKINMNDLNVLLDQHNMATLYHYVMMINKTYFKITYKENLVNDPSMTNINPEVINYIKHAGIHGLGREFNIHEVKAARYQLEGMSKRHMIFDMMFPSYQDMKWMYPRLMKIPILLPLAWLIRLLSYLFSKDRKVLSKLKALKVDQNRVSDIIEVFDNLSINK